jgi:hypothetical protein
VHERGDDVVEHDPVGHSAAMTAPWVGRAELGTVRLDQGSELDPQRLDQGCWQQRHGLSRRSSGLQQSHDHLQVRASTRHDTPRASCAGRSKTGGVLDLRPVTATLDEQFPGKKAIRVVDRDGKVVMKAGRLLTD